MCAFDKNDDLGNLLQAGYGAPPPREAFVRDLGERMREEFLATQKAIAPARPRRALPVRWPWALAAAATVVLAAGIAAIALRPDGGTQGLSSVGGPPGPEPSGTPEEKMVPLEIKLPRARVDGTAKNIKPSPYLEKPDYRPRPPFMVPQGTTNVALGRPVTSSDPEPIIGELKQITDGDKEGADGSFVELGPGKQWVQIDLKEVCHLYAILLWHGEHWMNVYHDVIVQASNDRNFVKGVHTLFNNDYDNSSGLGAGKNLEYIEDYRGRLIDAQAVMARFVRIYSKGNIDNDMNHYVEVEVYGRPAPAEAADLAPLEIELPRSICY